MKSRAFTLLELVAAMTLLSTLLALVVMGTVTAMDSWQRLQRQARALDERLRLERTLDQVLSNAIPFTWPGSDLKEHLQFIGQAELVQVAYRHPLNRLADGAVRLAQLTREDHELVAYYTERAPFPESLKDERVQRSLLAHGVKDLQLAYADFSGDELTWRDDWEKREYLPLAVRLTLTWDDGEQTVFLRRTGGSAAYERQGDWRQDSGAATPATTTTKSATTGTAVPTGGSKLPP